MVSGRHFESLVARIFSSAIPVKGKLTDMETRTLVSDVYLSKTEALRALSQLFEVSIDWSDPAEPVLVLEGGVVLSIEVPKFGEDLPLTVDLSGDDAEVLDKATHQVIDLVGHGLSWSMSVVGQ